MHWRKISIPKSELNLKTLLTCGQSFTWKETGENIWTNVLQKKNVISLTQTDSEILWCTPLIRESQECQPGNSIPSSSAAGTVDREQRVLRRKCVQSSSRRKVKTSSDPETTFRSTTQNDSHCGDKKVSVADIEEAAGRDDSTPAKLIKRHPNHDTSNGKNIKHDVDDHIMEAIIRDYFQLDINLEDLYNQWSKVDKHFEKIAQVYPGIRIMRQDPTENLFSFICSSNNHVSRIGGMVQKLAENYGTKLGTVDGVDFFSFPTPADLVGPGVETRLRELGFGYRAKFIATTAKMIHEDRPEGWLDSLRTIPYQECIQELVKLQGVGRKVADCVALMSLDKPHVVPVDTHVLQIAARDYRVPGISKDMKSLTPAIHDKIGRFFVDLYGDYAGWAHTVLFAADLRQFSDKSKNTKQESAVKSIKAAPKGKKKAL